MSTYKMTKLYTPIPNPQYQHLIGDRVDIDMCDGRVFTNRILHFAGLNSVRHNIITTGCCRGVFYVQDWNQIKITKSK
jgi:hypothetical protein